MNNKVRKKDIAIIGMSAKFPESKNIEEFWQNLCQGKELVHFYSDDELRELGMSNRDIDRSNFVSAEGRIEDTENFDSSFFGYTKHEAASMDPQIRLLHEQTWLALEDAGCNPYKYDGKIGLYIAASDNLDWRTYTNLSRNENINPFYLNQISNRTYASTLISYKLNLKGPSYFVDTACSSSLVAIHIACRNVLMKECTVAIAGGVSISSSVNRGYYYEEGSKESKDGYCRAFDKDASGIISGEGVGLVVLKKLEDAINDRDHVYAIIRSSAVNNDGDRKIGYTAPSIIGQCDCIKLAHQIADISPDSISYIETHGTGTRLGDPIEIEALNKAFDYNTDHSCAIGSVKTNMGHLDTGSGVAGLIKTTLALKNKEIPISLHFNEPNPEINFKSGPFHVNTKLTKWENNGGYPLRAGVSSFGIGGTNAHVILEEAPPVASSSPSRSYQLLNISAKTFSALKRNVKNLKKYLECNNDTKLSDLAYTLKIGRSSFPYRKILVCKDRENAIEELSSLLVGGKPKAVSENISNKIVFMFPGQGSQHVNMCADLYKDEKAFQAEVDKCFRIVQRLFGKNLKSVVFSESKDDINNLEFALPLIFIFEYSLARLMMYWGIQPDIMIGHSNAEYVAACISGVFTLESALELMVKRGELMQKMPPGKMLSISISEDELSPYLEAHKDVSLAAINSPESCVVSGPEGTIDGFQKLIEKSGFMTKTVRSSHAGHSHMMDDILAEFETVMGQVNIYPHQIPFISNVTGKKVEDNKITTSKYWADHLRHTVKFSDGISEIMTDEHVLFVEVGPGKTLGSFVGTNQSKGEGHKVINLLGHPKARSNDILNILSGLGKLWLNGIEPNWRSFYKDEDRQKVSIPTYSFDKFKYPVRVNISKMITEMISDKPSVLGSISDWFYVPTWEVSELINDKITTDQKCLNMIFLDNCGVGKELMQEFERIGVNVIGIKQGKFFNQNSHHLFEINPTSNEDYTTLFETIKSDAPFIRIIFAWGVSEEVKYKITRASVKKQLNVGFYSLLNIIKTLNLVLKNISVELISITNNLHQVLREDYISPEKAPLLGAVRVIPKEYSNVKCRNIDITLLERGATLTKCIFKEIVSDFEHEVSAYRHGSRFVNSIKSVKVIARQNDHYPFISGGVYLITGGLGGIGLTIAKKISENVKGVNLILLGRKDLTTNGSWKDWVSSHDEENPLYDIIKELSQIEENGSKVYYSSVDVSNHKALEKVIRKLEQKTGAVCGVIHSAGVADFGGVIHRRTKKDSDIVFAPKIYGTLALSQILSKNKLDFFVLHSSLSSMLGHFGEVGHVAANLFLDSFAKQQATVNGARVISIGWNAWRDVGQAAMEAERNNTSVSIDSISPEDGYEVLIRSIKAKLPQSIISVIGPKGYSKMTRDFQELPENEKVLEEPVDYEEVDSTTFLSSVEESLFEIWQNFLSRSDFGVDTDFFELGGDSLKAVTLINRMQKFYGVEISLIDFYSKSNIKELANEIKLALKFKNIQTTKKKSNVIKV